MRYTRAAWCQTPAGRGGGAVVRTHFGARVAPPDKPAPILALAPPEPKESSRRLCPGSRSGSPCSGAGTLLEVHDLTAVAGVQRGRQAAYEPVDGAAVGLRLQRAVATLSGIYRENAGALAPSHTLLAPPPTCMSARNSLWEGTNDSADHLPSAGLQFPPGGTAPKTARYRAETPRPHLHPDASKPTKI
jgi:hypothetical protein